MKTPVDGGKGEKSKREILPPKTVVNERYTIVKYLASGGMARVYVALQAPLGRRVALKVLNPQFGRDPDAVKRFFREAKAVSRLNHPNTITVFDFERSAEGFFYIAMELLEGESLGERLEREGRLSPEVALPIAIQVARSLSEAHRKGIIHRDLKPDNVFISSVEKDLVKVIDFGIAAFPEASPDQKLTQTGAVPGTPEYMSPEHAQGFELDGRADIYALGIVIYEMLSGSVPFSGSNFLATVVRHVNDPVPPLEGVDPRLADYIVNRLLNKDREQRPGSAEQFIEELEALANQLGFGSEGRSEAELAALRQRLEEAERYKQESESRWREEEQRLEAMRRQIEAEKKALEAMQQGHPRSTTQSQPIKNDRPSQRESSAPREWPPRQREADRGGVPSRDWSSDNDSWAQARSERRRERKGGEVPQAPSNKGAMPPPPPRRGSSTRIERQLEPRHTSTHHSREVGGAPQEPKIRQHKWREVSGASLSELGSHKGQEVAPRPTSSAPSLPSNPTAKFQSFAKPLLALLGPRPTAEQLEQAFVMARTVWNAVLDGEEELMMARSYIKRSVPQLLPTIDDLIETKHRDYEDDRWRVAEISVGQAGGRLKVQIQVLVGV